MFYDVENQLSDKQAFTGAATVSTNSYQKQTAAQDVSIGRRMCLLVMPTVNAGAGSTVQIDAIQSAAAALTSPDVLASVSIAAANFVVGKRIVVPFPQGTMSKQFLGAQVTITGGTTTASCDIYLMPEDEVPVYKSFPKVVDVIV
jgi:hypothetical protein